APALGEDEWWAHELEGCEVFDGPRRLGSVTRMIEYPSCEVLEVRREEGTDLLVPMVKDAIRSVRVAERRIEIDLGFVEEERAPARDRALAGRAPARRRARRRARDGAGPDAAVRPLRGLRRAHPRALRKRPGVRRALRALRRGARGDGRVRRRPAQASRRAGGRQLER